MKKKDLKKLALMGIAGGFLLATQSCDTSMMKGSDSGQDQGGMMNNMRQNNCNSCTGKKSCNNKDGCNTYKNKMNGQNGGSCTGKKSCNNKASCSGGSCSSPQGCGNTPSSSMKSKRQDS